MKDKDQTINSLIELNEDLENYFANTIIPQLFVDDHLRLRKFTPPAMKQFDLKKEDVGRLLSEIVYNIRFPAIIKEIRQVIDSGEILQKEVQSTDMYWYQMNILPYVVRNENRSNGVIITFIDITMRIKDLKEQEDLVQENELLLDTIAHDIKNPLSALGIAVNLLKKPAGVVKENFPALLIIIEKSMVTLNKVFNELVRTRWHGNRYEPEPELLDLENILEDVKHTLAHQIHKCGAIIKTDLGKFEITFPRRKLRSIVYNLVNNALKYRSHESVPEIAVESHEEHDFIVITISDNGIGIAPENLELIFCKYHQEDSSVEGDGVGLYLVKEILERSGGKIIVESKLNSGTTFKVFIPASER